jgi:excisionase family DNA binding protein
MRPETTKYKVTQAEVDAAHTSFDWLVPLRKNLLTTQEVARCIAQGQDYVRQLIESGRLEAHQDSAFGSRLSNRVTRRSVVVHLSRTAKYEPDTFLESLIDVAVTLSREGRARLINALQALGNNRP